MKNKTDYKKLDTASLPIIFILTVLNWGCSPKATDATTSELTLTASDAQLLTVISANALTKLTAPAAESNDLVLLGETLFADNALSGNRNISCQTCHSPQLGTGDSLPFSIGTGGTGIGLARRQVAGQSSATPRNAPPLYNLGRANQIRAFFDGRVSLVNRVVTSSVTEISGNNPNRNDIVQVFTNVFDIQPLFPLLSSIEMLGANNDLSAHTTDLTKWQGILSDRLLTQASYVTLFNRAFPTTTTANLNPGHIGRAIGAFMKIKFQSNNTPFDNYVSGNLTAMTESQKRGMIVFYNKGQCVRCHAGTNLTDENFHTSGAPQIGFAPFVDDLGRAGETNATADQYRFKTPSLRNISLTAPFMHDGAFETLEAVVEHYNNIQNSLATYTLPASYQAHYDTAMVVDTNSTRNRTRLNQVDNGALRNGLNLTTQEKSDLVEFLRNGLRDPQFN